MSVYVILVLLHTIMVPKRLAEALYNRFVKAILLQTGRSDSHIEFFEFVISVLNKTFSIVIEISGDGLSQLSYGLNLFASNLTHRHDRVIEQVRVL